MGAILLLPPSPSLTGSGRVCLLEAARQKFKCSESFGWHQSHPFTCSSLSVGTDSWSWVTHGLFRPPTITAGQQRGHSLCRSLCTPWPCTGLLRTESLAMSPPSASLCPLMLAAGDFLRIRISWPKGWHRSTNPRSWGAAGCSSAHPAPWHAAGGLPVCAHPPPCAHALQPPLGTRIFPVCCCRCRYPLAIPGSVTARRAAPNLGGL